MAALRNGNTSVGCQCRERGKLPTDVTKLPRNITGLGMHRLFTTLHYYDGRVFYSRLADFVVGLIYYLYTRALVQIA